MEHRELGRSGVSASRIVLGCGNFGGVGSSPAFFGQGIPRDEAVRIMDSAWELGITTFDTADAYGGGRSETWIGEWLATKGSEVRDTIGVETKTFNPVSVGADHGLARARIHRQIDESLGRLGLERVALYFAHDFDPDVPQEETLRAFDDARARGQDRRRRCFELQRRTARGGGRALGARGPDALRGRPEFVLASRQQATPRPCSRSVASTGSATRRSGRSRAAGSPGSTAVARRFRRARE